MQAEFWMRMWQEGRIGFHRDQPLPLLCKHWKHAGLEAGTRVLVPLCGKSRDMLWLAGQGHRVLGVELAPRAVEQFFAETKLPVRRHESAMGVHHVSDAIEIIQGNALELDQATLASCQGIYDRAAIVALPEAMRRRYGERIYARLPADSRGLLITLEYPQAEMDGPPFSVGEKQIRTLLDARWDIEQLEHRDILSDEPKFAARGLSRLHTGVYRLECH